MDTLAALDASAWRIIASACVLAAMLLVAIVATVNRHGRKLDRHQEWMRRLELSVGNLHRDRRRADVRILQVLPGTATARPSTARPPTLSDARTVEIGEDDLLRTNPGARREPTNED